MIFSEDSRVKIPCILHLIRLGYRYLSLKGVRPYDEAAGRKFMRYVPWWA